MQQEPAEDTIAAMAFDTEPPAATTAIPEATTETPWWERIPPGTSKEDIAKAATISLGTGQVTTTETTVVPTKNGSTAKKEDLADPETFSQAWDTAVPESAPEKMLSKTESTIKKDAVVPESAPDKANAMNVSYDTAPMDNYDLEGNPDKTIASNTSSSTGDSQDTPKSARNRSRRDCLGLYFVCIFILVSVAVVVPLAVFTTIFTGGDGDSLISSSSSESSEGGGLPIPTPVPTSHNLAPEETDEPCKCVMHEFPYTLFGLAGFTKLRQNSQRLTFILFPPLIPVVEYTAPTMPSATTTPTASPVTQTPTFPDTTPFPTLMPTVSPSTSLPTVEQTTPPNTAAPSKSPTAAPTAKSLVPTVKPTTAPTTSPTISPTVMPTSMPTTAQPTVSPSSAPVDISDTPLFEYLTQGGVSAQALANPDTPQGKALRWIMQDSVEQLSVFRVPQLFALVALDYALHESAFFGSVWRQENVDYCDWQGVTCDANLEVTELKWSDQGLSGAMIPELKILNKLTKVDMAENAITGTLDVFWDLPQLTHLYMFSNKLYGEIPSDRSAPTNLQRVYLGSNQLTGSLPLTLVSSTNGPAALSKLCLGMDSDASNIPKDILYALHALTLLVFLLSRIFDS